MGDNMRRSLSRNREKPTLRAMKSLRLRMGWSLSLALVVVMGGMTVLTVLDSRREQIATERTHAEALLDHLVQMSSFRAGIAPAQNELNAFAHYLRGAGVHVNLVPITSRARTAEDPAVAERFVNIAGSPYLLRYTVDTARLVPMLRRTAITHLLYGLAAIAAHSGSQSGCCADTSFGRSALSSWSSSTLARVADGSPWFLLSTGNSTDLPRPFALLDPLWSDRCGSGSRPTGAPTPRSFSHACAAGPRAHSPRLLLPSGHCRRLSHFTLSGSTSCAWRSPAWSTRWLTKRSSMKGCRFRTPPALERNE